MATAMASASASIAARSFSFVVTTSRASTTRRDHLRPRRSSSALRRRGRVSVATVRASADEEDDWDGNPGPFVRPEGSPFFASYTDPTVWKLMQETLRAGEIEQILPAKAKLMAENDGWTLIDVRPYPDYCERHAWGALNAQLYAPQEVNDIASGFKAAATLALFPERIGKKYVSVAENDAFLDEMQDCVEWGSPVILYCQNGGIIGDEADDYEEGLQTVSLIAAHELAARGWGCEAIKHMAGGLAMWDEGEGFDVGEVRDE